MDKEQNLKVKKIKKMIILLFIVFLILLTVIIIIYNNPTDRNLRYIYNTKKVGTIDIMPTNVEKLFVEYRGKLNARSIYKAMDVFTNKLVPKYFLEIRELKKEDISKYFKENYKIIEKELGIKEEEKFYSFCENLKKNLKGEDITLTSYTVYPENIKKFSTHTDYIIIVKYNNTQKIAFKLSIQHNFDKEKTPIYYEACIDEKILEYEYIPNDYQTPNEINPTGRVTK